MDFSQYKSGDTILFTGTLYTARDAAHLKIQQLIDQSLPLPVDFNNAIIYYAGPTPTKPGNVVGSIGPTTSSRMDKYAPLMKKLGVIATIGKGPRSEECFETYQKDGILYFITTGGIGALLSKCVTSCEVVAFPELGTESIKKLTVKDFPITLAYDSCNNNIFRR